MYRLTDSMIEVLTNKITINTRLQKKSTSVKFQMLSDRYWKQSIVIFHKTLKPPLHELTQPAQITKKRINSNLTENKWDHVEKCLMDLYMDHTILKYLFTGNGTKYNRKNALRFEIDKTKIVIFVNKIEISSGLNCGWVDYL